jgi:cytidylate kinase
MSVAPLIITIDGPAGTGKSTAAHRLAKRLGLPVLDTGAMYRAITAACLDRGIDPADSPQRVIELAQTLPLSYELGAVGPRLTVDDVDVTHRLRQTDVNQRVSHTASLTPVRRVLVRHQQRIGKLCPRLVTEGRDQGSVVFPAATVKFYLDAEPWMRARRRAEQQRSAGQEADEGRILAEIQQRDHLDSTRPEAPLICPPEAIRVDTTGLSLEEVVDTLEEHVRRLAGDRI